MLPCPRCRGALFPTQDDTADLSCMMCGHVHYVAPAPVPVPPPEAFRHQRKRSVVKPRPRPAVTTKRGLQLRIAELFCAGVQHVR